MTKAHRKLAADICSEVALLSIGVTAIFYFLDMWTPFFVSLTVLIVSAVLGVNYRIDDEVRIKIDHGD